MANLKLSTPLRNGMLDIITSTAGTSAVLTIYSGTQPAGGGTPGTALAVLTGNVTAFAAAASAGTLSVNAITADSAANATGTASYFRIETSGATWVMDGDISTVAAGTGDLTLDDTSIVLNGTVSLGGPNSIIAPNAA